MLDTLSANDQEIMSSRGADGDRSVKARFWIALLFLCLVIMAAFSLATGASDASVFSVVRHWFSPVLGDATQLSARDEIIIYDIRLPRMVLGVLIGASLAVCGAILQGLFRNPLADPGIVGVSAGAALGAVCMIVLGGTLLAPVSNLLGIYALPLAAFSGSGLVTALLYRIATRRGHTSVATMLLAGIALAALAAALTGILIFIADDQQLRDLTFWGLGSIAGATWTKVVAAGPIIAVALCISPYLARGLNAMTMGEATARHMGLSVQRFKAVAIVTVAAGTGAAVSVSGTIGFVGIVVPHLLRLLIGPDHRYLLPASALLGASLLLGADAVARTIVAPAELPLGIITAAVGAPFFLWILLSRRSVLDM